MSEKERREVAALSSEAEIQSYYRDKGLSTPPWHTNRSKQAERSLEGEYERSEAFLRSLEAAGDAFATPEIEELKAMFLKALEAVDLLQNMPRNKPKFREQIQELFAQAWERAEQLSERGYVFNDHLF